MKRAGPITFGALGLAAAGLLAGPMRSEARDFGVEGQAFPIIEPDLLATIESRLRRAESSGELARMNEVFARRVEAKVRRPDPVGGIRPRIEAMIRSMSDKIRSDTPLDAAEKQLLNLATVPLYKILAVQAYAHYALTQGEIQTLSEIVAVDLLSAMLDNMLDRVEQAKVHYQTFDQETAAQWRQQIASTRAKFGQRDVKLNNKLQVTMQIIDRSIMLESTLQNSMTPGMTAALNFSRGLSAQGLH